MSIIATVIGLTAAVFTTAANLPQLKKVWTTGETDDLSLKTLLLFGAGVVGLDRLRFLSKGCRHNISERP